MSGSPPSADVSRPAALMTAEPKLSILSSVTRLVGPEIDKPAGLLDTKAFFAPFLSFIDHMVTERFLPAAHRDSIAVDADADALVRKLKEFQRVEVPKWM